MFPLSIITIRFTIFLILGAADDRDELKFEYEEMQNGHVVTASGCKLIVAYRPTRTAEPELKSFASVGAAATNCAA